MGVNNTVGRPASVDDIERAFNDRHHATYGFKLNKPIEVVTIRVFAVITRVKPRFRSPKAEARPNQGVSGGFISMIGLRRQFTGVMTCQLLK